MTTENRAASCWSIGDADRLRQVVWNLLSNAVKFTPYGAGYQRFVAKPYDFAQFVAAVNDVARHPV